MPYTSTEKIDRKSLREMARAHYSKQFPDPALAQRHLTPFERSLQGIWASVFCIESDAIGPQTSFFQLGGTSIAAMALVAAAGKSGVDLTVQSIFRHPTPRDMARQGRFREVESSEAIEPFALLGGYSKIRSSLDEIASQYRLDAHLIEDAYPVSPLQEGLISLSLKHPGDYIVRRVLELSPDVPIDTFRRTWERTAYVLPILRTRLVSDGGSGLLQLVLREPMEWAEATGLEAFLQMDDNIEMGLGDRLSRHVLVKDTSGVPRWFVWTSHHAVCDGHSQARVVDIADQIFRGQRP
ncbi:destruxin synthetase [Fusarium bulbicola]|nr:destruxin synthetase [Fusarium bulbicola]